MTKEELTQSIYTAFKDIKLEDGVGLLEAAKIDEHYKRDSQECKKAYQEDERTDWRNLLDKNFSDWAFMDAKGIRFHLPCFLLQDLDEKTQGNNPLISILNNSTSDFIIDKLSILTINQKSVVLNFLDYKIEKYVNKNDNTNFMDYQNAKNNFEQYIIHQ